MNNFYINDKEIGGDRSYIIAEIGQAHDGSLGTAHAYIDAVAQTGVDAIKFQTHIAHAESTRHEKFRVKVFPQDETRYDYWKRMEFKAEQWKELSQHAKSVGLDFLSTPFSPQAVDLLDNLNVPAFKIGSGDTNNTELIEKVIKTKKPILLSSGMSNYSELDEVVNKIKNAGSPIAIFQCTTSYPCSPEDVGYNVIQELKERYDCATGLSDHSGFIYPSLASITLGAKILEVHTVFSRQCFGPDTNSSLTLKELKDLVDGVRFIERGLAFKVDKSNAAENRKDTKQLFSRSAFYTGELLAGKIFERKDFAMKKPGGGLTYEEAISLVGRKLKNKKSIDDYIDLRDFL